MLTAMGLGLKYPAITECSIEDSKLFSLHHGESIDEDSDGKISENLVAARENVTLMKSLDPELVEVYESHKDSELHVRVTMAVPVDILAEIVEKETLPGEPVARQAASSAASCCRKRTMKLLNSLIVMLCFLLQAMPAWGFRHPIPYSFPPSSSPIVYPPIHPLTCLTPSPFTMLAFDTPRANHFHLHRSSSLVFTTFFIAIVISSSFFFLAMRVIWDYFSLEKIMCRRFGDMMQRVCDGSISVDDAVNHIQQHLQLKRHSSPQLHSCMKTLDLKKIKTPEIAFNIGSFFGRLYNKGCIEISMFSHLQLSHKIAKEVPFVLPFLSGLFQAIQLKIGSHGWNSLIVFLM